LVELQQGPGLARLPPADPRAAWRRVSPRCRSLWVCNVSPAWHPRL